MATPSQFCIHDFHKVKGDDHLGQVTVVCVYCGQVREANYKGVIHVTEQEGTIHRKSDVKTI